MAQCAQPKHTVVITSATLFKKFCITYKNCTCCRFTTPLGRSSSCTRPLVVDKRLNTMNCSILWWWSLFLIPSTVKHKLCSEPCRFCLPVEGNNEQLDKRTLCKRALYKRTRYSWTHVQKDSTIYADKYWTVIIKSKWFNHLHNIRASDWFNYITSASKD